MHLGARRSEENQYDVISTPPTRITALSVTQETTQDNNVVYAVVNKPKKKINEAASLAAGATGANRSSLPDGLPPSIEDGNDYDNIPSFNNNNTVYADIVPMAAFILEAQICRDFEEQTAPVVYAQLDFNGKS